MSTTQRELAEKVLQLAQNGRRDSAKLTKRGLNVEEFCKIYGICRSLAYIELKEGRLKARKVGRRTIIASEDAELWFSNLPRVQAA